MAALKPITIIGGGLAGLALGIGLRLRGIPVTVYEATHYPRHRVCGEFISGRGQQVLRELGLEDVLREAGAIPATTAMFRIHKTASPVRALPSAAICISRFKLDAVLAARLKELGGELVERTRWCGADAEPGVVRASGRRLQPIQGGWRWFGLKVHARNVSLAADLEMHACATGYVGLCRLGGGEVNICGVFRRPAAERNVVQPSRELLRGSEGSLLRKRLETAAFDDESFCAVAGLSLRPCRAAELPGCRVGDALTMIPPVTGNGMSMAFESAKIAIGPLGAYSGSEISWPEAKRAVAETCDRAFARRLAWAKWLHGLMFMPLLRHFRADSLVGSQRVWNTFFSRTR